MFLRNLKRRWSVVVRFAHHAFEGMTMDDQLKTTKTAPAMKKHFDFTVLPDGTIIRSTRSILLEAGYLTRSAPRTPPRK